MESRLALYALALALLPGPLFSAQGVEKRVPSRMRVYFSALDKQEKPVLGLGADNFELRVDGHPTALDGFRPGLSYTDRSIPVLLWILIDWNPNIKADMIRRQADAAAKVFDLFNRDSLIGVKLVSDRSETLAPLAHDPASLRRALADFSKRRGELRVGSQEDSTSVGRSGLIGAAELAIDDLVVLFRSAPSLEGREVHSAVMIISDANINPNYSKKPLYEKAALDNVFLYPVFVPRAGPYGLWVQDYFDLAKRTAGVASVFGALNPGSKILPLPRGDIHSNALTFNFIHMARDLNGKYSFEIATPSKGREVHLDLKAKIKNVRIRMARRVLP